MWFHRFDREYDNIRAALACLCHGESVELGCALATNLVWYWYARGFAREAGQWLELAIEGVGDETSVNIASAITFAGNFRYELGDKERAEELHELALVVSRKLGDARAIALSLAGYTSHEYDSRACIGQKRALAAEVLELAREVDDKEGIVHALAGLAHISANSGEIGEAEELFRQCVDHWVRCGFKRHAAMARLGLAQVAGLRGDFEEATVVARESVDVLRGEEYQNAVAFALRELGDYEIGLGDAVSARVSFIEAVQLCEKIGNPTWTAACLNGLGEVARAGGMSDRAVRLFGATSVIYDPKEKTPMMLIHDYSGSIASLREELGSQFDLLWQEGRRMSINEAVRYALDLG